MSRRPRRPRIQVDADSVDDITDRWKPYLTDEEYDAGLALLHGLRELERQVPERLDQTFWRR
jgi:hypothetical protein